MYLYLEVGGSSVRGDSTSSMMLSSADDSTGLKLLLVLYTEGMGITSGMLWHSTYIYNLHAMADGINQKC